MTRSLLLIGLLSSYVGCSSGGAPNGPPGSGRDLTGGDVTDLSSGPSDLSGGTDLQSTEDMAGTMPSDADCFTEWPRLTACPAPQITEAYLGNNCVGTTGVFVVGRYFQSGNKFWTSNGFMPYGPYALPARLNRDTWNFLSPRLVCITTSADPGTWTGFEMQLKNPDGQLSNVANVLNRLGSTVTLPSSGSSHPFDGNACMDPPMSLVQAQARIIAPASTATLGMVTLSRRSRACNSVSGCGAWGPTTLDSTLSLGLKVSGGNVNVTLGTADCGVVGSGLITTNICASGGSAGSLEAHVSAGCAMLWQRKFSTVGGDGNYTQTDWGAVIKY
ncbi:MAG: hypothetical protein JNJ46_15265 [Myxococcales bacterium]|nr:hypothetical protein [Myxococcales bacterium]